MHDEQIVMTQSDDGSKKFLTSFLEYFSKYSVCQALPHKYYVKQHELTTEEIGCVSRALFLDLQTERLVCVWPNSEIGHAYEENNANHIFDPTKIQELLAGKDYHEIFCL